jgi:hypothetical protein
MMLNSSSNEQLTLKHSQISLSSGLILGYEGLMNYSIIGLCISMNPIVSKKQKLSSCSSP